VERVAARCVSKAEFAKLAGVSKPAISKALRGKLGAALVDDRIDIDHPASVEYLRTRGKTVPARAPTKAPKKGSKPPPAPTRSAKKAAPQPPESTEPRRGRPLPPPRIERGMGLEQLAELSGYADLTMRQLARRWGTFRAFADMLDALKTIEEIRKTNLHNEEREGGLIARELVRASIFGTIESAFKRLLTDAPGTISGRVMAMAKSGSTREDCERVVRELISGHLKVVKAAAIRVLRGEHEPEAPAA